METAKQSKAKQSKAKQSKPIRRRRGESVFNKALECPMPATVSKPVAPEKAQLIILTSSVSQDNHCQLARAVPAEQGFCEFQPSNLLTTDNVEHSPRSHCRINWHF